MKFLFAVAWRNLWRHRRRTLITAAAMDPVIAQASINHICHQIGMQLIIGCVYRIAFVPMTPVNFRITITPNTVITITAIDRIKAVTTNQNVVMYVAFKAVITKANTAI